MRFLTIIIVLRSNILKYIPLLFQKLIKVAITVINPKQFPTPVLSHHPFLILSFPLHNLLITDSPSLLVAIALLAQLLLKVFVLLENALCQVLQRDQFLDQFMFG